MNTTFILDALMYCMLLGSDNISYVSHDQVTLYQHVMMQCKKNNSKGKMTDCTNPQMNGCFHVQITLFSKANRIIVRQFLPSLNSEIHIVNTAFCHYVMSIIESQLNYKKKLGIPCSFWEEQIVAMSNLHNFTDTPAYAKNKIQFFDCIFGCLVCGNKREGIEQLEYDEVCICNEYMFTLFTEPGLSPALYYLPLCVAIEALYNLNYIWFSITENVKICATTTRHYYLYIVTLKSQTTTTVQVRAMYRHKLKYEYARKNCRTLKFEDGMCYIERLQQSRPQLFCQQKNSLKVTVFIQMLILASTLSSDDILLTDPIYADDRPRQALLNIIAKMGKGGAVPLREILLKQLDSPT